MFEVYRHIFYRLFVKNIIDASIINGSSACLKIFSYGALFQIFIGFFIPSYINALDNKYVVERIVLTDGRVIEATILPSPPHPPLSRDRTSVALPQPSKGRGINTLSEVPAFDWSFGCTATSAAMIAGYWDRHGYVNMYSGPTNGGLMPLNNSSWPTWTDSHGDIRSQCPLSATRNGLDGRATKGHVDDYWNYYGDTNPDPFIGHWTEHAYGECTADYMKTNQSTFSNTDGSTTIYNYTDGSPLTAANMESGGVHTKDGGYGLKLFYESRGYTVVTMYNQYIKGKGSNPALGFTYEQYKAEIDAGRPVMIHVQGHTMVGIGYDDSNGQSLYIHDTWDYNAHTMTWGGAYSGMNHYAVTIVQLATIIPTGQATNIQFNSVQLDQLGISWTNGNGIKRAVFIKQADNGTASPVNGTTYTANAAFGSGTQIGTSGWYCVYNGTGNSVTITTLNQNTIYRIMACEYGGAAASEAYNTGTATGNPANQKTKQNQAITFLSLPASTYGDADFAPGASASSGLTVSYTSSNTSVATIVSGKIHITGAGTCKIYADQSGNGEYMPAPRDSQQLIVNKESLTATADNKSRSYGVTNPTLTVTYSGFVNSENESVLDTKPTAATTAIQTSSVNTYPITVSGGTDNNYDFSYASGTLTITKATITATADNKSRNYGAANPALTIAFSGFVNNENDGVLDTKPTSATTATQASYTGTYPITVSGGTDNNYDFSYASGTLTITKATITATADHKSRIYGSTNPALTITYSGFVNSENESVLDTKPTAATTAIQTSSVNTYPITVSGGTDNNYDFGYVGGTLTITKATITATADHKGRSYGSTNPALTITYSGFVNSENESILDTKPTAATTAIQTSSVNTYPITVSGGTDSNYDFSYASGTLTITKATITATADNKSRNYGAANPALTIAFSGFVNNENDGVLDTKPTSATTATHASYTGTYPITVSGGTDNNYDFGYVGGTLTIAKATITATADNKTRSYGFPNPELTVTYSGFVNSENDGVLDTKPAAATTATQPSDAGTYPITLSGGADNNYTFTYTDGVLFIVKAYQFITFGPIPTKKIGDPDFSPGAAASSGLQVSFTSSNANVAVMSGNLIHITGVGNATITASQAGNGNYNEATPVQQVLTVDNAVPVKIINSFKDTYRIVVVPNPVMSSSDGASLFLICKKPVYAVKITISDCLGNVVYKATKDVCYPDITDRISLAKWDLTGKMQRKASAGSYRAAVQFTDSQGIRRSSKTFIGVKK